MNTGNVKFETKRVKIDSLVTEGLQVRVALDEKAIADYARDMKRGDEFPPIVVFRDAARPEVAPYLADGFHRIEASRRIGQDTILAEMHDGSFNDALAFSLKANSKYGVRRTNDDKRHALEVAWENWRVLLGDETPKGKTGNKPNGLPSGEQLAAICCVSDETARRFMRKYVEPHCGSECVSKASDEIAVPEICDDAPDALTVTKKHLEERDPSVRALLRDKKDRFGIDIPEKLRGAFLSRTPNDLIRGLNGMYAELEKRRLDGDVVFAPFVGRAMTHLDNLINTIRHGRVYCVCRMCRGEGCGSCNELGFQTRPQYDRNPPEFKAEKQ